MVPLLIASSLSILATDRPRVWPALALIASAIVFSGSHLLTDLWTSTLIVLTGIAILACVPAVRARLVWRRALRLIGLLVPALLINAWFVLPLIAYQSHTSISSRFSEWRETLEVFTAWVSVSRLFTLQRVGVLPSKPYGSFILTLPTLAIAWVLVGMILFLWRGPRGAWPTVLVIFAVMTTLMTVVMTHASLILALPRPYAMLQFSYRLENDVLLGVSATTLALLVLVQRDDTYRRRVLRWMLGPVLIVAVAGAIQQAADYPSFAGTRQASVRPGTESNSSEGPLTDYVDVGLQTMVGRAPEIDFPAAAVHDESTSKVLHLRPRQLFYTNIGGGPELVHVSGATIVGLGPSGNDVLEVDPPIAASSGTSRSPRAAAPSEVVSVRPADGLPVVIGRLLTLAAAIVLVLELAILVASGTREWSARRAG
jgi:hypothetical protein